MSVSITHLGSGSRGNATLISSDEGNLLIDNGFSGRQLEKRLGRMELAPSDIDGILVSHHHGDHGGGAELAMRRWGIPVYANARTAEELGISEHEGFHAFESLERLEPLPDVHLLPFPVPHAGADNVGFTLSTRDGYRAAVVTDLGSFTDEVVQHLADCAHISIEANYDVDRLTRGPYPQSLKRRIMDRGGHLSNEQTGALLARVVGPATQSIVLSHLSIENNRPHLAESTVLYHIDEVFSGQIAISLQDGPDFSHFLGQTETERLCVET